MFNNYSEIRQRFEQLLAENYSAKRLGSLVSSSTMAEAVAYSMLAGGKRLRPSLVYKVAEAHGLDFSSVDGVALSLEAIHCSSLVHDDLPGVDGDLLRRGKPSTHAEFGETQAIMAGNSLISLGIKHLLSCSGLSESLRLSLVESLSSCFIDICAGQVLDVETREREEVTLELLRKKDRLKTGSLFELCFYLPALVAGLGPSDLEEHRSCGQRFGQFFQMVDDLKDSPAFADNRQRPPGGDSRLNTKTSLSHFGAESLKSSLLSFKEESLKSCPSALEAFICDLYNSLLPQ